MSNNILVSLLSEHLIPNFQLFQHLKEEIDEHLLITTAQMEQSGVTANFIEYIEADNYPVHAVVTDAWDFEGILGKLEKHCEVNSKNQYFVNLTGGTKMVSLAVFHFFRALNSRMYYVAIGANSCRCIYPDQQAAEKFNHQLSLKQYLGLYGYSITYNNTLHKSPAFTRELFATIQEKNYNAMAHAPIRSALAERYCPDMADLGYYQGLWFEEYVFQLIKEQLQLNDSQLALGVKVRKYKAEGSSDNEFDVMFIKNNRLYAIECKSSLGKKNERIAKLEGFLYKLAAAVKNFGLQVSPILAAVGSTDDSQKIRDRAEILRIKTIGSEKFENENLLDLYLKNL
ncbi:MAG: Card1-like endonuclease domain-containing protein [Marinifilaceae bacterium]